MRKNTFIEGTLIAYIMILISKILGAIYVIPFYQIIGDEGGVLYSYAYNVYVLFLNISTSGIPTAISIIIAEYNAMERYNDREKAFQTANRLIGVFAVISFAVMFIFAGNIVNFFTNGIEGGVSYESIRMSIRCISLCLLVIPFTSILRGYLQGSRYVAVSSISQVLEQLARIFVVLAGSYTAIRVLKLDTSIGVAVALLGTVIGGLIAYIYLRIKVYQGRDELRQGVTSIADATVSARDIIKRVIIYAIPVVLISVTENLYNVVDMKLIIKGLYMIGYQGNECEYYASVINTWGPKICTIITALAMGLCASIIPYVSDHYIKKNYKGLNEKYNQAISIILYVAIPLAMFLIFNSGEVYRIFYGESQAGSDALKLLAFINILYSIQLVMNMMLQGMKQYKLIFTSTLVGLVINAILDIPMIFLLNNLGLKAYLGTLLATALGEIISIGIILLSMKRKLHFEYGAVWKNLFWSCAFMVPSVIIMLLFRKVFFHNTSYIMTLIQLGIAGMGSVGFYAAATYLTGISEKVFGVDLLQQFLKRLHIR